MYKIVTVLTLPEDIHNHSELFVVPVIAIFEKLAFVLINKPTLRQMRQFSQE